MANEAYRLRSLAYRWEDRAGEACANYRDYKGRECAHCTWDAESHAWRKAAEELRALLAEPVILPEDEPVGYGHGV